MNVSRIELRDFRSYARLDLDLPDGATALVGPNGAGKSSILTAIEVALFGAPSLEPYLRRGADRLEVTLYVDHDGHEYRIRRGFRGRSSLDFEQHSGDEWRPGSMETQKATQRLIEDTLGLTRETFRASAYLAQGDSAAITSARPAERMAILRATIGGLELYERAHDRAKDRHRVALGDAAKYAGASEAMELVLAESPEVLAALADARARQVAALTLHEQTEDESAAAELAVNVAREHLAELRALEAERRGAAMWLEQLGQQALDARQAQVAIETETERKAALEAEAAAETQLALEVEELAGQVARHGHEQRAHEAAREQLADLTAGAADYRRLAAELRSAAEAAELAGPGEARCSECGQSLGAEALAESISTRRAQATDYMAHCHDFEQRAAAVAVCEPPPEPPAELLAEKRDALAGARNAKVALGILDGRLKTLREAVARVETAEFREAYQEATHKVLDAERAHRDAASAAADLNIGSLELAGAAARSKRDAARERVEKIGRELAVVRSKLGELDETERRLRANEDAREVAEHEVAVLAAVADMFAPAGIPLLVIEGAVPLIEQRAQEVLERLGGQTAGCRVELVTQRANKGDGALRDTLEIVIHTAAGDAVPYEQWSGGERMRLDLAIRVGLAQLLLVHGANVELFAVDEPDGLDAQGRAALVEVIEDMADRYGFRKVLLISHDDSLRDSLPQAIEVERTEDGSRIAA